MRKHSPAQVGDHFAPNACPQRRSPGNRYTSVLFTETVAVRGLSASIGSEGDHSQFGNLPE